MFDGQDYSKLENWFMDIEPATDMLTESHTYLTEAKLYSLPTLSSMRPFKQENAGMRSRASLG